MTAPEVGPGTASGTGTDAAHAAGEPARNRIIRRRYVTSDDYSERWHVEEREIDGRRFLFFANEAQWVRVREFPADWTALANDELLSLVHSPSSGHVAPPPERASPRQFRILVVDDNPADRYLAKRTLGDVPAEVFEATSARSALEIARLVNPDIILLDYVMPGVMGADAIRLLRSEPSLDGVPILIVTGYQEIVAPEARSFAAGVLSKRDFPLTEQIRAIASTRTV